MIAKTISLLFALFFRFYIPQLTQSCTDGFRVVCKLKALQTIVPQSSFPRRALGAVPAFAHLRYTSARLPVLPWAAQNYGFLTRRYLTALFCF